MNKIIEKFKSVGEETRLRILRLLIHAGEPLCVCEIFDVLQKPQYTISRSLTHLRKAELVEEQRYGKMMMYRLIENEINRSIFDSIAVLPPDDPLYRNDFDLLARRLSLRREGKCVITYRNRQVHPAK